MEKNKRISFGLLGGLMLLYFPHMPLPVVFLGWVTDYFVFPIMSFCGAILVLYFSIWLIIDACKAIFR